ncbi:MAG: hypothetical protein KGI41_00925 [Patescibacteria group bacterium]|nr:hypothetical protein [Patescibacteria group bacterium]MDE1965792.1 hypothetical protein [Patescibacteria group bacterium]
MKYVRYPAWSGAMLMFMSMVAGVLIGQVVGAYSPWSQMIVNDRGHALYEVANVQVRSAVIDVVGQATGLTPFMHIKSGPTDQVVLSDGITVFMTMHEAPYSPADVRMFVVNDPQRRWEAVQALMDRLDKLGYRDVYMTEPDSTLPHGTMFVVWSPTAFPGGGGIGFRPDGSTMAKLVGSEAKFY